MELDVVIADDPGREQTGAEISRPPVERPDHHRSAGEATGLDEAEQVVPTGSPLTRECPGDSVVAKDIDDH
ncbi:MAG: hypothetical protein PHO55_15750 [Thiomonas arsenitoxydans]|nr:hypothetical protein [Thiomonas arsenitoxydans]